MFHYGDNKDFIIVIMTLLAQRNYLFIDKQINPSKAIEASPIKNITIRETSKTDVVIHPN